MNDSRTPPTGGGADKATTASIVWRIVGSFVAVTLYGLINGLIHPATALVTAKLAGQQFQSSDPAYLTAIYGMNFFSSLGIPSLALLGVLVWIWWKELKKLPALIGSLSAGVALALMLSASPASAFFEKTDRTEAYPILPNQSAFWIPEIGDSRGSQAQTEDEAYYIGKKVQLTRFVIPHQKLTNSAGVGTWSWDYFVPTGRLIIVDRTPYSREWVDSHDRGSSAKKDGFPCQSNEGLDVTVGVTLAASVSPANAARYLYRFGVVPPKGEIRGTADAIENDGRVIFTSVYYSRSVQDVMDLFGRKKILELVCDQISGRTLDQANRDAKLIKDAVSVAVVAFFETYGITIDFIGWADTFTFDPLVQAAINRRYAAGKDQEVAALLAPHANTMQALATAYALRAFGDKTDGRLPTTIVGLPADFSNLLGKLLGSTGGTTIGVPPVVAPR